MSDENHAAISECARERLHICVGAETRARRIAPRFPTADANRARAHPEKGGASTVRAATLSSWGQDKIHLSARFRSLPE